jgi:RHS repeat-associated protein
MLGNLAYSYDQLRRKTQVTGSFARTNLPGAVTSMVYDSANELTSWNGTAISYDLSGNMLADGSHIFTWNGRGQMATLNSVALQYDAVGRRVKNATGTSFLYSGGSAVQELSGSTPTANLLTGGLDELFQRSDNNGTVVPLADALGSTIALVDSSGNINTTYSCDPFGNTTAAGAVSGNPSQYAGRENDGNGLYFMRARYYSPALGRFISEDPAGLLGGLDFYSYVSDSPTNASDPLGLWSPKAHDVMFWNALHPCDVSNAEIYTLQQDSRRFDTQTGIGEAYANDHAMAKPGQTTNEAIQGIQDSIALSLDTAHDAFDAGGSNEFALDQLAIGMHTIMDLSSPAHTHQKPNGSYVPITWCAPMGCWGNLAGVSHSPREGVGIEDAAHITADIMAEEVQALRLAYEYATGRQLTCKTQ